MNRRIAGIAAEHLPLLRCSRPQSGDVPLAVHGHLAFLVSYVALGEAGKYTVPSVGTWVVVEVIAGCGQFTLFGLLLWLVHRRPAIARERAVAAR